MVTVTVGQRVVFEVDGRLVLAGEAVAVNPARVTIRDASGREDEYPARCVRPVRSGR